MNGVIEIVEVGPRDGLQNERETISIENKREFINRAVSAGAKRIEVASFVNPNRVPQMADAEELIASLRLPESVTSIGLVLNMRGVERALATEIDELGAIVVATDEFAIRNQKQTSNETVEIACEVIQSARAAGRSANVTIGASFGCPFEGEVPPERVVDIATRLAEAAPREISFADTIGVGDPWNVVDVISRVKRALPEMPLRAHFHNTRNTGLANAYAAISAGVSTLDASLGGIGGCPFAPAATGNIPTEDLAYMLERAGLSTGLDLGELIAGSQWLSEMMNKPTPAMVSKAGGFPKNKSATV